MHLADGFLAGQNFLDADDSFQVFNRMLRLEPLQHGDFDFKLRVAQTQPDEKPVQLRLGQGKRAFVVNWILRGNEKERRRQFVIIAVGGHLAFRHGFQQRGLGARRGAVDFIRQQDLGEERAGAEFKFGGLGIENGTAGDVIGQQIRRALDAFEIAADAARQSPRQHGLGHAGHIFQKHVPLGKIRHHGHQNFVVFADHHFLDVANQAAGGGGGWRIAGFTPRCAGRLHRRHLPQRHHIF